MLTDKNKLSLIFLAPALILALDLSMQIFSTFTTMDINKTIHSSLPSDQVTLLQNSPDGLMSFTSNDVIDNYNTVTVSPDKMNVFYLGVDNPISINTNIPKENIQVTSADTNLTISKTLKDRYFVRVRKPGFVSFHVTNSVTGIKYRFQFRAKRIPSPIVHLGNYSSSFGGFDRYTGGVMSANQFKAQVGLTASLDNFDFDAKCSIKSFTMYHTPKGQEPIKIKQTQTGDVFSPAVLKAIQAAKPGDQYTFFDVKTIVPGNRASNLANSLSFIIK
ncbi:MAG: hypothetical protein GY810_31535 [Aureispira sp.]|nr:hypothetical protein [Aureispira sp.]